MSPRNAMDTDRLPDASSLPDPGAVVPVAPLIDVVANTFVMGNDAQDAIVEDGEGPARRVSLSAFSIAAGTVTNREFADFVRATGHVTDAERRGSSEVFVLQLDDAARRSLHCTPTAVPWWLAVDGASWKQPEGPGSHVYTRAGHPVVHVSWDDAMAYCAWAGARLPTEAQWECAARGGLSGWRYAWGDTLMHNGKLRCNVWRGEFPHAPAAGWAPAPMPAISHAPNGFGLYNVCGNVWEWCADWFSPAYHAATSARDPLGDLPTGRRSLRGGSFLCDDQHCNRHRVAARASRAPHVTTSDTGFRIAR